MTAASLRSTPLEDLLERLSPRENVAKNVDVASSKEESQREEGEIARERETLEEGKRGKKVEEDRKSEDNQAEQLMANVLKMESQP